MRDDSRRFQSGLTLALCLVLFTGAAAVSQTAEPPATPAEPAASQTSQETPANPPEPLPVVQPAQPQPADTPAQQPPAEGTPEQPIPQPGEDIPGSLPQTSGEPATPPNAPAPSVPANVPGATLDRINFQLKFPADQGGGSAAGSAGNLEYKRDDYAVLTGGVKIRYQDVELEAEEAEIDLNTKVVNARGNVILDQGPRRLTGDTAEFNLGTKLGKLSNATAQINPDYYFKGTEVAKIGEDLYTVTDGIFTSCNQKTPDWSFKLGRAQVEMDGYAHVKHATIRAKNIPFFYTPYILWPTKTERSSGFLVPNFGFSDRRGASLGLAYFQTLGRSYDTTFHVDTYTEGYLGLGNELRYRPSQGTQGTFLGYLIRDPDALPDQDEWRWKLEWNTTTTDLPRGMRGGVQYQDYSDFEFFRDFERDFDRNTLRFIDSRAFLSGNWGPHLLNVLLNDRETFITRESSINQRKLPEIEYRLRSTRLGKTPLYAQFQGSASYLDLDRPGNYTNQYGRIDAFPQLSLPIRSFPWLNLTVAGGGRFTYWGDSISTDPAAPGSTGEAITRTLPFGSAQIIGPSFSRIFGGEAFGFSKLKHVIEPRWTYTYQGEFDEAGEVPLFDEVDRAFSTNSGRFALVNRVLAKPKDEKQSAREVLSIELARSYSFDETQPLQFSSDRTVTTSAGPLEALVRWSPGAGASLRAVATYDTLFSGL